MSTKILSENVLLSKLGFVCVFIASVSASKVVKHDMQSVCPLGRTLFHWVGRAVRGPNTITI